MARNLSKDEKTQKGLLALQMRVRHMSYADIAKRLDVHRNTVPKLIRYALKDAISPKAKEQALRLSVSTFDELQRVAWVYLNMRRPQTTEQKAAGQPGDLYIQPTSHNLPKLLAEIRDTELARIKLLGLAVPEELNVNLASPAERVKALEDWRRRKQQEEQGLRLVQGGRPA